MWRIAASLSLGLLAGCSSSSTIAAHDTPPQPGPSATDCRTNPHLPQIRSLYDELRYDEAEALIQRAIEYHGNCKEDLVELYRVKGYIDAVNNEQERCLRDFQIMLSLQPSTSLPEGTAPKILDCFKAAVDAGAGA